MKYFVIQLINWLMQLQLVVSMLPSAIFAAKTSKFRQERTIRSENHAVASRAENHVTP